MNTLFKKIQRNKLYYKNRIEEILKEFPISGKKVLDLGCGEMLLREYLTAEDCFYTGVDQNFFNNRENFVLSDILNFNFECSPYDIIFLLGVIDHMPGREKEMVLERVQEHFSKVLVISQFNSKNLLFHFLFPDKKEIDLERWFKGYHISKLALFKFPFFQSVYKLSIKLLFSKFLATEYVYVIRKQAE